MCPNLVRFQPNLKKRQGILSGSEIEIKICVLKSETLKQKAKVKEL